MDSSNQVSISQIGVYGGNPCRVHHLGGDAPTDYHAIYSKTVNCSFLCANLMMTGGLWGLHSGGDPHYVKCFDSNTPSPPNGVRVAFVSQLGTTNVDPDLPQATPITNVSACMRTIANYLLCFCLT